MTVRLPRATARATAAALLALCVPVVAVLLAWAPVAAASAGPVDRSPTTSVPLARGDELGNSLPLPNSGSAPRDAGDRGGAAQVAVFGLVVVGIGFIGLMVAREVRRGRRRLEATASSPSA